MGPLSTSTAAGPQFDCRRRNPCPRCQGAIGWRTADGSVRCAACYGRPHGAEKVLLITLTGGNTAWVDFAEELAIHRARMAAKQA